MRGQVLILTAILSVSITHAATTIDINNAYAYGANTGWINARGDVANGMVVGQAFCSGWIYSANCGWIHLGDGDPDNGIAYSNASASDYGVNHDGLGNLSGYAYGANIGWLNFEQTYGEPTVDLLSGDLNGHIWSANTGWISLNTTEGFVRTETMDAGPDVDGDGIADAWEYGYTNDLAGLSDISDFDGDGVTDIDEYIADTNPHDSSDLFLITLLQVGAPDSITWTVKSTRQYTLQFANALSNGMSWADITTLIPSTGPTYTEPYLPLIDTNHFYRVRVTLPLSP